MNRFNPVQRLNIFLLSFAVLGILVAIFNFTCVKIVPEGHVMIIRQYDLVIVKPAGYRYCFWMFEDGETEIVKAPSEGIE